MNIVKEMQILTNELINDQPPSARSKELDYKSVVVYLNDQLYNREGVGTLKSGHTLEIPDSIIVKNDDPYSLMDCDFYKQLLLLLGSHQLKVASTLEGGPLFAGAFIQLATELGMIIPDDQEPDPWQLFKTLSESPSHLISDIDALDYITDIDKQAKVKKYLAMLKKNLEIICYLMMQRPDNTNNQTRGILSVLFSQLNVCSSGLEASLLVIKSDLQSGDIATELSKFRLSILHNFHAMLMARRGVNPSNDANSVHFLNVIVQIAHQSGFIVDDICDLNSMDDGFASAFQLSPSEISDLESYIREEYRLEKFVKKSIFEIEAKLTKACAALKISTRNGGIPQDRFAEVEGFLLQTLKQYSLVESSTMSIPAQILDVADNIYDEIAGYNVWFTDDPAGKEIIKHDNKIILIPKPDGAHKCYVYMNGTLAFKRTASNQFLSSFYDNDDNFDQAAFIVSLAKNIASVKPQNLEYFLLKALASRGLTTEEMSSFEIKDTPKVSGKIKMYLNRYDKNNYKIYISNQGEIYDFDTLPDNLRAALISTKDLDVLRILLLRSVASNDTSTLHQLMMANDNIGEANVLESLYEVAMEKNSLDAFQILYNMKFTFDAKTFAMALSHVDDIRFMKFVLQSSFTNVKLAVYILMELADVLFSKTYGVHNLIDENFFENKIFEIICCFLNIKDLHYATDAAIALERLLNGAGLSQLENKNIIYLMQRLALSPYSDLLKIFNKYLVKRLNNYDMECVNYVLDNIELTPALSKINLTCEGLDNNALYRAMQNCKWQNKKPKPQWQILVLKLLARGASPHTVIQKHRRDINTVAKKYPDSEILTNPIQVATKLKERGCDIDDWVLSELHKQGYPAHDTERRLKRARLQA